MQRLYFCICSLLLIALQGCTAAPSPETAPEDRPKIFERTLVETEPQQTAATNSFAQASPKQGWNDFNPSQQTEGEESSTLRKTLLWLPNRLLDLIDIFRIDIGAGPAAGGVVRITKYAQGGIRTVAPASLRVGDFGRDWPVKIEHSSELGISPAFLQSKDREVCPGEVGVGIDLFIVGAYAGICFDELADFFGGIFLEDIKHDDLR